MNQSGTVSVAAGHLVVGEAGFATVTITHGGRCETVDARVGELIVGWKPRSRGEITVSGRDSSLDIAGDLRIGIEGMGNCRIESGARLNSRGFLYVGPYRPEEADSDGSGQVWLSDPATHAVIQDGIVVGGAGIGQLKVSAGAWLETPGSLRVDQSQSRCHIENTDTRVVAGTVEVGAQGSATLSIHDQARLSTDDLRIGLSFDGIGETSLQDRAAVTVVGNTTVGQSGSARLALSNAATLTTDGLAVGLFDASRGEIRLSGLAVETAAGDQQPLTSLATGWMAIGGSMAAAGGQGDVQIESGSQLTVSRELVIWPGSTLAIEQNAVLQFGDDVRIVIDGTLKLAAGAELQFGENVTIAGTGTIEGSFTLAESCCLEIASGQPGLTFAGDLALSSGSRLELVAPMQAAPDREHLGLRVDGELLLPHNEAAAVHCAINSNLMDPDAIATSEPLRLGPFGSFATVEPGATARVQLQFDPDVPPAVAEQFSLHLVDGRLIIQHSPPRYHLAIAGGLVFAGLFIWRFLTLRRRGQRVNSAIS